MALTPDALLDGPRGRYLCLATATRLHAPLWDAWLRAAWHASDAEPLAALVTNLSQIDVSPLQTWRSPSAFIGPMDRSVSDAMGWQEPHDEDRITGDPAVVHALRPIAAAIAAAPAAAWWGSGIDLRALRCTSRYDDRFPPTTPQLTGAAERLLELRGVEVQDDHDARLDRSDDPSAPYSGRWWSTPADAHPPTTTRPLDHTGSVALVWEEDSFGQRDALIWAVEVLRPPRIWEIGGGADWVELVRRYPLDVTWSRRHDWYRVTGRVGPWRIPDWAAVSREWDGVHLSVAGYLHTATRALDLGDGSATLLAGWDPDQTWWLTGILTADLDSPSRWHATSDTSDASDWNWQPSNR